MKKNLIILISLLIFVFNCYSQATVDPNDYFYSQAQIWEVRGLVSQLPPIRPYTKVLINQILNEVIEKGSDKDVLIAKSYYEELNNKPWNLALETEIVGKYEDNEFSKMISLIPSFYGDVSVYKDLISIGYKVGFVNKTEAEESFLPMYQGYNHNTTKDAGVVGPFKSYLDSDEVLSIGNTSFFGQGGIYRSAYGSFIGDNLAISEQDTHAGNISFTFLHPRFSYAQQLSIIGASRLYDVSEIENNRHYVKPEKYAAFHELTLHFFDKLDFTYYETMVYGKRFELVYMLPVVYMAGQGLGGYDDNLQMGVALNYRPINQLMFSFDSFVDDVDFNKLVKFKFQGRQRFAIKTGINYSPDNLFFTKADFNYTLITPFTYSHYQGDESNDVIQTKIFNYQDCTNSGKHIGTIYDPNSQIFNLNFDFNPLNKLVLRFNNSLIYHGNVCENYTDDEALKFLMSPDATYATDGSINTHQIFGGKQKVLDTAQDFLNLLNQNHMMYIIKSGITADYELPKYWKSLTASFNVGYTFQYVHNYGINTNLFPGGEIVKKDNGTYYCNGNGKTYENLDELKANTKDIVECYRKLWEGNLRDLFSHYFTIGVTIKY